MRVAFLRRPNLLEYRGSKPHSTGSMAFSYSHNRHIDGIGSWESDQQGSSLVHHAVCNDLLFPHFSSHGLATRAFNVLDVFLYRHYHRDICNGLIVTCCHDHLLERSPPKIPGYGIQCDHDNCCLQYIAGSWFRRYH